MRAIAGRFKLRRLLVCIVFMHAITCMAPALASEQIALMEDSSGLILPAGGICSNFMYPNGLCLPQAGPAFYAAHPDNYDILIFITNKNLPATEKTGYPVNTDVKGIGNDTSPWHYSVLGSDGRLLQAVTLGSIQSMPDDPEGVFPQIPISGLEVIGHEIGHHWMSYVDIDFDDGRGRLDILRGYRDTGAITHWSCWLNSDSVMYGGMLTDNGDGSFTDINGPRKFSYLDQYLMGLRRVDEVGPLWYVESGGSLHGCADWPEARGVAHTINGNRVDFAIEDIIHAMGERDPVTSPCHYKVGFVFVHLPGFAPSPSELAKFENYRTAIESWWVRATDGRGSLDTRLDGCGTGTEQCPGKPSAQCNSMSDGDTDFICSPEERICAGMDLLECAPDGSGWEFVMNCADLGGECLIGSCVGVDGDSDHAGEADTDRISEDGDNDDAHDLPADGDGGGLPDGDVSEATCEPGTTRCLGTLRQRCSVNAGDWLDIEDCSQNGDRCTPSACIMEPGSTGGCSSTGASWWFFLTLVFLFTRVRRQAFRA